MTKWPSFEYEPKQLRAFVEELKSKEKEPEEKCKKKKMQTLREGEQACGNSR